MKTVKAAIPILVLFLFLVLNCDGFCQDFPSKSIKLIVPYAAGGDIDMIARLISKPLEKALGGKIYVELIPGGSGKVGTVECEKANPDGYTIVVNPELVWLGVYYSGAADHKFWETLTPLGNIASEPYGFYEVRAESPFKTWMDLLKYAKENPNKELLCGLSTRGVFDIMLDDVERSFGVKFKHVPFTGGGPVGVALLGGHIDFRFTTGLSNSITFLRAGKTRGLAMQTEKRLSLIPDVPTFKEMGHDVMTVSATRSIWGPPNMPKNLVEIYTRAIEKATNDPEFKKSLEEDLAEHVDFRPPSKMLEAIRGFEKQLGPKLAEFYK